MLQLNKKRIVQGRLDAERLLLQLGSQDNKDVLNLGMGAELSVQVLNEAKEKLSRELLSPNDSAALLPLEQLKLLYAILCQVTQGKRRDKRSSHRSPGCSENGYHQPFCKW